MAHRQSIGFKNYLFIVLTVFTLWYLFQPAFSSYFFQDDWFSFSISSAKNLNQFLQFFAPRLDLIYYRPLGIQLPFFVAQTFFGINPLPFRLATLLVHLFNGFLVFKVLNYLIQDAKLAFFGAILYVTSATHFTIFFWASTFSFVLASLYFFGSFILYIRDRIGASILVFIFGLLTNELIITLPIIISSWAILVRGKKLTSTVIYWITSFIYVFFRVTIAKFPTTENYSLVTSLKEILINLRNFVLWSFNWPETISDQFIKFLKFNPLFIENFRNYVFLYLIVTAIFLIPFALVSFFSIKQKGRINEVNYNLILFGLSWFVVALFPTIFFKHHSYTYYLPIPIVGLIIAFLELLKLLKHVVSQEKTQNFILFFVLAIWYISAYQTVRLNVLIHWAPRRALLSQKIVQAAKLRYPTLPNHAVVIIAKEPVDEYKWALGDQNGFQVIYDDPSIATYYMTPEDLSSIKNKNLLQGRPIFVLENE